MYNQTFTKKNLKENFVKNLIRTKMKLYKGRFDYHTYIYNYDCDTFLMRMFFKLISNWFSRCCSSLNSKPDSSWPITCLHLPKTKCGVLILEGRCFSSCIIEFNWFFYYKICIYIFDESWFQKIAWFKAKCLFLLNVILMWLIVGK